jgi:hypothetical protein
MQKCFIFCFIVGDFKENLENVFELFAFGRDEEHTGSTSAQFKGTVKVHDPMIWNASWRRDLFFPPFSQKVD